MEGAPHAASVIRFQSASLGLEMKMALHMSLRMFAVSGLNPTEDDLRWTLGLAIPGCLGIFKKKWRRLIEDVVFCVDWMSKDAAKLGMTNDEVLCADSFAQWLRQRMNGMPDHEYWRRSEPVKKLAGRLRTDSRHRDRLNRVAHAPSRPLKARTGDDL